MLFRSLAASAGPNALGLILTGAGDDGARGLLQMKEAGARTMAQDEATSVEWGTPGEAVERGAADVRATDCAAPVHSVLTTPSFQRLFHIGA